MAAVKVTFGAVEFWQTFMPPPLMVAVGNGFTVMVIVAVVAHWPAVGINV